MKIILDTEIFEHENFCFTSRKFLSLKKCITQEIVNLYITEINHQEIKKRFSKKLKEAEGAIKGIRSSTTVLHNFETYRNAITKKDIFNEYFTELERSLDEFISDSRTTIIPISNINPKLVFDAYFNDKAPFNTEKKKHEFPDAISLMTIQEYFKSDKEKCCIVSGDKDIKDLIETLKIEKLKYYDTLESLLDEILPNAQIKEYFKKNTEYFIKSIKEKFEEITINLDNDYYESEEQGREFTDIVIHDISVIDSSDEVVYLQVKADISYNVSVAYNDPHGLFWDSEEKDYIYVGDTQMKVFENTETIDIEIECERLEPDGSDWSIYIMDYSLSVKVDDYI